MPNRSLGSFRHPNTTLTPTVTLRPGTLTPTITLTPVRLTAITDTPTVTPTPQILAVEAEFGIVLTQKRSSATDLRPGSAETYQPSIQEPPSKIQSAPSTPFSVMTAWSTAHNGRLCGTGLEAVLRNTALGWAAGAWLYRMDPGCLEWLPVEYEVQIYTGQIWKVSGVSRSKGSTHRFQRDPDPHGHRHAHAYPFRTPTPPGQRRQPLPAPQLSGLHQPPAALCNSTPPPHQRPPHPHSAALLPPTATRTRTPRPTETQFTPTPTKTRWPTVVPTTLTPTITRHPTLTPTP
jgi:hypothetical protein